MYLIYLDNIQLPVAPSKLDIKIKDQNKTMNLINGSEINILRQPGLSEFSFTALLPNVAYPFASYPDGFHNASYYISVLEMLKVSRKHFKFDVIRPNSHGGDIDISTTMIVSLEDYTITEDAGEGFDFKVDIKLKQFIPYSTATFAVGKGGNGQTVIAGGNIRAGNKTPAKSYTIKKGDTLWSIAKTQLCDGSKDKAIYALNKDVIEKKAKQQGRASSSKGMYLYYGTVILLPK